MGLYSEKKFTIGFCLIVFFAFFAIVYLPWLTPVRELFRQEGLLATEAFEFQRDLPIVHAHNLVVRNGYPLFPALAALINQSLGVPMESTLRAISLLFLLAGAVLVFFSAAKERSFTAGYVAAAIYTTTMLCLEKSVVGTPATANAFWLLAAQMLFFYYGIRKTEWNRAWISSALLMLAGFFTGGPAVLLYFIFPMLFFRRPLSVKSKFRHFGFPLAVALVLGAVASWSFLVWLMAGRSTYGTLWLSDFSFGEYFSNIVLFPLLLPLRLLPWSLISWVPFCVALQAIDPKPIFSRYLRTLFLATLALLWFSPESDSYEILYLTGSLSILCGMYYELGMRRYGVKLRKILGLGEYFSLLVVVLLILICVAPQEWLLPFVNDPAELAFRHSSKYLITAAINAVVIALLAGAAYRHRERTPVWMRLLLVAFSAGLFYSFVILPGRLVHQEKRQLGRDIAVALIRDGASREDKIYKVDISDLYGALYYTNFKVVKIDDLTQLPEKSPRVYLLSTEFPAWPQRNWKALLPDGYTYLGHKLSLWQGTLSKRQ